MIRRQVNGFSLNRAYYLWPMFCRFLITIFCILTAAIGNVFGQTEQYSFSRRDISEGLSSNEVNCFYKDKQGFLWVGTVIGLNRYDGYGFKVYRHNNADSASLSGNRITRILEGPDDKMWVGLGRDFDVYDLLTDKVERNETPFLRALDIEGVSVTDIRNDGKGNYFFLMDRQSIYKYNSADKHCALVYKVQAQQNNIFAFVIDKRGNLNLINNKGIITVVDYHTQKLVAVDSSANKVFGENVIAPSLFLDNDNELWIHYRNERPIGVLRLNLYTHKAMLFVKGESGVGLNTNIVRSVLQADNGDIWIATDHGGINVFNKKTSRFSYILHNDDNKKSLSQNSINASYKDSDGIIWLGTYKQGVCYYHENITRFPLYSKQPSNTASLPFNDINRFLEDGKGNLWIGTNGGGLIYFNRATNTYTQYRHSAVNSNSIASDVVVSLLIDHKQRLWIGTYLNGLDCYENGNFTHYKKDPANPNSISDNSIWELYEDGRQNLWIGTLATGLDRLDLKSNIFYKLDTAQVSAINTPYIASLCEDDEHNLWIGTNNGLSFLDTAYTVTHFANTPNQQAVISDNNVICIFQDSRRLVWVGTINGLSVYNKKTRSFQLFNINDGLPSGTILNILEDDQHRLWMSTANGLCATTVEQKKDGSITIHPINYDEADGLQGTLFNENAALKTSGGELIFGGANGFNLFYPSVVKQLNTNAKILFTSLQLFNRTVAAGEKIGGRVILSQTISHVPEIILKHDENIIAIEFARLDFFNSEKIKYAYKLIGFNQDWTYTDSRNRKAIYTNLDPGTYTFTVKATNEDGRWNKKETTLLIKINPPFWKTTLAYLLYACFIISALWFARRIILERASMRFEVVSQRKEAERIQELDAIKTKFFTNVSHEFRTPLSLILLPLEKLVKKIPDTESKKQLQLVQRNAKRLLNLVNQLLDFRKMEVQEFSMNFIEEDIVLFTRDITYSFSDISEKKDIALTFSSNTEKLYHSFDKDKLEKILFNLLSNAFKYTPGGGKVNVDFSTLVNAEGKSSIQIKVTDSGIGISHDMHDKIFERFYQLTVPGDIQSSGSGIGLAITKEFVKLHGGTIRVESEPDKGTSFVVTLPVNNEPTFVQLEGPKEEVIALGKDANTQMQVAVEGESYEGEQSANNVGKARKLTLLLVEDNEDFRFYLKDNLKLWYEILEAVNGKDGWDKVREYMPDMIISDIMMPVWNGIELSKKIKDDPRTSHIPLILLTAMGGDETELKGFKAGTNDYITKPFTFEILASRIKNLFNIHDQLRRKFQQQIEITPAEVTVTSVDEDFMKQAFAAVEKNMDNTDYSVDDLSRDLLMSRASMFKKLVSITGKTPLEFIRIMRLKRAALLLQKSQKNITEIAYETGFSTPKIFTKHFKEEFGVIPSLYRANNKDV
ncbi:two-component regulator propeller domain-containing protein [soil metagenome]